MEKDAVSAGVMPAGGLFSTAEIRILICYIISTLDEAVPGQLLANTLHYEGIANIFEVSDSIADLVASGHLSPVGEKDDLYIITPAGKNIANTLKTSLPLTVKDRAYNAALKMLARFKNSRDSKFEISNEGGKTYISCTAIDGEMPIVSVKLLVADEEQALHIKEKFLNDSTVYSEIIDLLTKQ